MRGVPTGPRMKKKIRFPPKCLVIRVFFRMKRDEVLMKTSWIFTLLNIDFNTKKKIIWTDTLKSLKCDGIGNLEQTIAM